MDAGHESNESSDIEVVEVSSGSSRSLASLNADDFDYTELYPFDEATIGEMPSMVVEIDLTRDDAGVTSVPAGTARAGSSQQAVAGPSNASQGFNFPFPRESAPMQYQRRCSWDLSGQVERSANEHDTEARAQQPIGIERAQTMNAPPIVYCGPPLAPPMMSPNGAGMIVNGQLERSGSEDTGHNGQGSSVVGQRSDGAQRMNAPPIVYYGPPPAPPMMSRRGAGVIVNGHLERSGVEETGHNGQGSSVVGQRSDGAQRMNAPPIVYYGPPPAPPMMSRRGAGVIVNGHLERSGVEETGHNGQGSSVVGQRLAGVHRINAPPIVYYGPSPMPPMISRRGAGIIVNGQLEHSGSEETGHNGQGSSGMVLRSAGQGSSGMALRSAGQGSSGMAQSSAETQPQDERPQRGPFHGIGDKTTFIISQPPHQK